MRRGPSRTVRAALLATPLCLGALLAAAAPSTTPRCSLIPFALARWPTASRIVATALPDTVLAGPGDARPSRHGGHWGAGAARPVYGQLVRIDTLAGEEATAVRAAFARTGAREAVVVPWDYDASCETTYWSRSARWVEPGLTGFYTVRARPQAQWIDGRPTFDAFNAALEPYPHGPYFQAGHRGTDTLGTHPSLTPTEMFSLHEALPAHGAPGDSASLEPLRRWVAAHPEAAHRYPARWILDRVLRRRGEQRLPRDG
jgi:hypothetical protein